MANDRTPADLLKAYHSIPVETWASGKREVHNVRVNRYLMANWSKGSSFMRKLFPKGYGKVKKGTQSELGRPSSLRSWDRKQARSKSGAHPIHSFQKRKGVGEDWNWVDEQRYQALESSLRRAAMGKGFPEDIGQALELALNAGQIKSPTRKAIQAYCDKYFGVDCSGLVGNYFVGIGRMTLEEASKKAAEAYFDKSKLVQSAADIRRNDVLVWMAGKESRYPRKNPGHVVLVDKAVQTKAGSVQLSVVEATADKKPSPLQSVYEVIETLPPQGRSGFVRFRVKRHGNLKATVSAVRPFPA